MEKIRVANRVSGKGLSRGLASYVSTALLCNLCLLQHLTAQDTAPVDTQVPVEKPAGDFEPITPLPAGVAPPPAPAATMAAGVSAGATPAGGAGGSGAAGAAGVNDILNFQTDLFTGRFTYSVPIIVAPARQGAEPKLALAYNSGSGNGWCGVGWGLDVGYIERDSRKDVPVDWNGADALTKYSDSYGFVFNFGGVSGKLINVGGNEYRNEIDSTFLKFNYINQYYWQVTDKGGNKFLFGVTPDSRMNSGRPGWTTNNSEGTFRWALNRVLDVNGNETTLTYTTDQGYLYLSQISYNGNVNSPAIAADRTVTFTLADRNDQPISYRSNYKVTLAKRLTNITVSVNGQRVRRYGLAYTYSPSTFRSMLSTITQFGATDSDSLPPLTLSYQVKPFAFETATNWTGVADNGGAGEYWSVIRADVSTNNITHTYVDLRDIDGDGLPDRVYGRIGAPYDRFKVQRNNGSGFDSPQDWGPLQSQSLTSDQSWSGQDRTDDSTRFTQLAFVDVNGDGYPDRVMDSLTSGTGWWLVETNTGLQSLTAGFSSDISFGQALQENGSGNGWYQITSSQTPDPYSYVYVDFMDMTGDGIPDRVMKKTAAPYSYFLVQKSTGTNLLSWRRFGTLLSQGATNDTYWTSLSASYKDVQSGSVAAYKFVTLADLNGDGLIDRVSRTLVSPFTNFVVQYNNGAGFSTVEFNFGAIDTQSSSHASWGSPYSTYSVDYDTAVQVMLIDINGDGLPDRVMRKINSPYTYFEVQFNTGSEFTATYNFGPISNNSTWYWASPNWVNTSHFVGGGFGTADYHLTKADLVDMNGDGLPDRVTWLNNTTWKVQLNKGPFPDLLYRIDNGIGGKVDVTYAPSTQFNNYDKPLTTGDPWAEGARSLLPFPVYVAKSVATRDGFGNTNKTTYDYEGGMYDGVRREFRGFAISTATDAYGGKRRVFFHQGGGQDHAAQGEFQDAGSMVKKGIPYRFETIGTTGATNTVTLNKVEEAMLNTNGWCFPYISQTIQFEYEGLASYRANAQQFLYDTNTGNVLKISNLGEVTSVDIASHSFSDDDADSIYTHTTYASLGEILSKPAIVTITSDNAGNVKLREIKFAYDDRGNLTNHQAWLTGSTYLTTTSTTYDQYGNPLRITDAAGITTSNTYDTLQMFVEQKVTGGFTNTFRFNPNSGNLLIAIDAKGIVSSNAYDAFFRLTETSVSTNAHGPTALWRERYAYNLGGVAANISYNYVRKRIYDPNDTSTGFETYTYLDGLGRTVQTRAEAENGQFRVSDAFFDLLGRPLFATLPQLVSGSGFTITTGTNLGTYNEYDVFGRAYRVTPAVEAVFNSSGVLTDIYGTGGDSGSPVAATTTAFLDGTNQWATVLTDPEGKVKKSYYDAYGRTTRIIEITSGGDYTTAYTYDKIGNLTNIADHLNHNFSISYDNLGRKTSMTDPDMGTWSYTYDNASRLVQQIDAKNQKIEFVYTNDPLGRLTARQIYDSNSVLVATIGYVFDSNQGETAYFVPKGALFKITDREGWTKFGYDARGRTTNMTRFVSTNQTSYTITTDYDDADRAIVVKYPTATDVRINYSYDNAGHLTNIISLAGTGTQERFYSSPVFSALGQLTSVKYGANQQLSYAYYAKSKRLTNKVVTVGTNIQNLSYQYDKVSNLKKITDDSRPSGTNSASITSFTYDDLHRLTQLNSTGLGGVRNYSYNEIGNLMSNDDLGGGQYTYLSGGKAHQVALAGGKTYSYDACGNMVARGYNVLRYDEENRLVQFNGPSPQVTFGYADDGTRLWRNVNGAELTVWIGGIYENRAGKELCHVFANGQIIASFEPQGGVFGFIPRTPIVARTADTLERCFAWPLQNGRTPITVCIVTLLGVLCACVLSRWRERESGPNPTIHQSINPCRGALSVWLIVALVLATTETNVHAQVYDPVFYYYHPDHLGSSNILTDRAGNIVQQYEYTAFGVQRVQTSATALPITQRYTGQDFDEATQLCYYQSRYYDPEIGRFIQPDTVSPSPDDPQTLNRYAYAHNNPFTYVDPSGHFAFLVALAAAAVVAVQAAAIGAVVGAVVGGIAAAATGGNVGMGIIGGMISGAAVGFGVGLGAALGAIYIPGPLASQIGAALGGGLFGAAGGAASAAIQGGDPAQGAMIGGASGAVFGFLDPVDPPVASDGKETFPIRADFQQPPRGGFHFGPSQAGAAAAGTSAAAVSAIGKPPTWVSFIPVIGSGWNAINAFQNGNYLLGSFYTALAISDVFVIRSAATGLARGGWKLGSHAWRATRAWYGKQGYASAGQHAHHWLIPQNGWGAPVADAIKNQPWNLMPMASAEEHFAVHGMNYLDNRAYGLAGRLWYGSPQWSKAMTISYGGRAADIATEP